MGQVAVRSVEVCRRRDLPRDVTVAAFAKESILVLLVFASTRGFCPEIE